MRAAHPPEVRVANRARVDIGPPPYPSCTANLRDAIEHALAQTRFRLHRYQAWEGPTPYHLGGRCEPTIFCFYLQSGSAMVSLGGAPATPLRAGDLVLVPEGQHVDCWSQSSRSIPHHSGRISARLGAGMEGIAGMDLCHCLGLGGTYKGDAVITTCCERLLIESHHRPAGWAQVCEQTLAELFIHLIRREPKRLHIGTGTPTSNSALQKLSPALSLINQAYSKPSLRVSDLAKVMHLSEVALRKLCHRATGRSPAVVLRQRRIEAACAALAESDAPIKAIADCCGFADSAYFCRAFKQQTGTTPSAYRASERHADQ